MGSPTGSVAWGRSLVPAQAGAQVRPAEFAVVAMCFAFGCIALSFAMGRDLNWDYFNYHGYAAFDPFGARLAQDFFPAGYQGYLLRLAYLPFAWMDAAGWHSLAIGSVLAAIASLNLLFLYLICREFTQDALRPRVVSAVLTLLGAAASPFLLQIGSTFVDVVTVPPVMAALWLLVRARREPQHLMAGALVGAACALKLTNAPFAVGIVIAALASARPADRLRAGALAGAGLALGFLALYGFWGWRLQQLFGSPVFPLFNNVFKAHDFPSQAIELHRFVPQSVAEALRLPLAMLEHRSYVYVEGIAPDIRPLVLLLLTLAVAGQAVVRRFQAGPRAVHDVPHGAGLTLGTFCAVATLGWLLTSANGRYAVPLLLLVSPMIHLAATRLVGHRRAAMLCLLLLPVQVLRIVDAGNPRWAPNDWTSRWMPAAVPAELAREPFLFVSVATSSESYVAAHVHPDSVFVNPIGLLSIPTDGPGWDRFVALRDRHAGHTKVLFPAPATPRAQERRIATMNGAVDRLGLAIDQAACVPMRFNDDAHGIPFVWGKVAKPIDPDRPPWRTVLACTARVQRESPERLAALRAQSTEIMNAYERKCPRFFRPAGTQTEGAGPLWSRLYGKFDLFLTVDFEAGNIAYYMERQATDVIIGNVETWQRDVERFRCRLPHDGARDISTLGGDAHR